ncbi:MAG: myo-inositol-1-phosphate synthase [Planctomycetota bacterium]|nr:MAG: myo-inositol-1-phosphate synthase [Planctomycetota bacterium]
MNPPTQPRLGLWLIGARGGVAISAMAGLAAQRLGLADGVGLVTESPPFARLPLPAWGDIVVGGHDIRTAPLADELERLHRDSRVLAPQLVAAVRPELERIDAEIRPGTLWNVGPRIAQLCDLADLPALDQRPARAIVERLQADLAAFRARHELDEVVVLNVASTEPLPDQRHWPGSWAVAEQLLAKPDCPLPASTLYAIAALDAGLPYVNFTPSLGAAPAGIDELARLRGTCHAGRDGKTGETLLKSVLAPMFAARRLHVMSWVGHNIFGNLDGRVLDDPANKQAKLQSKDRLVADILGYQPQTLISIEHVESLGDWKTAWDHIHFRGFLDTPMTLQFVWQGCDSLLAAPLVLDLARLVAWARRRGETGVLPFLASFFKSPQGDAPAAFADQHRMLEAWAAAQQAE